MNRKRTKFEVLRDILKVLSGSGDGIKITHLICKSNLSNNSIKPHLKELIDKEFIHEVIRDGKKYFKIGKRGHEFLKEFNKIKIFSEAYGLC